MNDWTEEVAAAEAQAERFEAAESQAQEKFHGVLAEAESSGNPKRALDSDEFAQWMQARHATDLAWGSWFLLKGGQQE
ncbi:MAG TPA: hypothetical protein VHL79_12355 [Ramlibacter sp.]|jgi:hypothetical protein|nr:hypothetical protein [Ramlibacter sp.]